MTTLVLLSNSIIIFIVSIIVIRIYNKTFAKKNELLKSDSGLPQGNNFPSLEVQTINLKKTDISSPKIMIFTSYGCNVCKGIYSFLEQLTNEYPQIHFHLFILSEERQAAQIVEEYRLHKIEVSLLKYEQLHAFGITGFPFTYLVSNKGKILEKGLVNYKYQFDYLISKVSHVRVS